MALRKCKECGNDVATSATACPQCGAKVGARTGCLTWIVGGFFALVVFGMIIGSLESGKQQDAEHQQAIVQQREADAELASLTPEERADREKELAAKRVQEEIERRRQSGIAWNYGEHKDEMTGKEIKVAVVKSLNTVEFGFPYQGRQRASLQLRKHPRYGNDAILMIERGQFNCGIDECTVSIRFDDRQLQTFSVAEPADHSTTTLFIRNHKRFLNELKRSRTVHIEAPIYQQGDQVFEFAVDGLDW